jgi:hypothetical protein
MSDLDEEIHQILDVFSLLLVFVIAYFTALLPRLEDLLEEVRPQVAHDRTRLQAKLLAYQRLLTALACVILLILALALPTTTALLSSLDFDRRFSTLRAGFLLLVLLLVASFAWVVRFALRLRGRRQEIASEQA